MQPIAIFRRGAENGAAQFGCARIGPAPLHHSLWHQRMVPIGVRCDEPPAKRDAQCQNDKHNQRFAPQPLYRRRPVIAEKGGEPSTTRFAHAINQEIAARRQPFEIINQRRIEAGRPRNRQRRQSGAIEAGQRQ